MQVNNKISQTSSSWIRIPGKALLSGGYAIIYENQPGLSLSLNAFYFSKIEKIQSKNSDQILITILNPQFPKSDFEIIIKNKIDI